MELLIAYTLQVTLDLLCSDYFMYITGMLAVLMILNTVYTKILGLGKRK